MKKQQQKTTSGLKLELFRVFLLNLPYFFLWSLLVRVFQVEFNKLSNATCSWGGVCSWDFIMSITHALKLPYKANCSTEERYMLLKNTFVCTSVSCMSPSESMIPAGTFLRIHVYTVSPPTDWYCTFTDWYCSFLLYVREKRQNQWSNTSSEPCLPVLQSIFLCK